MADDDWYKPTAPQPPPRVPKPGEPLWAFVRERDRKRFECDLRFNGERYGWEAQIFEQGELFTAHGRFLTGRWLSSGPRNAVLRGRRRAPSEAVTYSALPSARLLADQVEDRISGGRSPRRAARRERHRG